MCVWSAGLCRRSLLFIRAPGCHFFCCGELQEASHVHAGLLHRPSGAPAGFKVLLSLMIIDAACLLNVLSGRLSICSTLTRVTARRPPPCTPVVMNWPQQQPCDRRNIIRNPVLLSRRKQIIFQSFLKSFVRRD